jgi:hypothetical protein
MLRSRHVFACGPGSSHSGRPNGGARRRNFRLDPRASFSGETAVIGKFRDAIGQRPIGRRSSPRAARDDLIVA